MATVARESDLSSIGTWYNFIAAQNAALAAETLGLGICYMGTTLCSTPDLVDFFDLPPDVFHPERDMMESRTTALQELGRRTLIARRLHELEGGFP